MAEIYQITTTNGTTYDIVDAGGRLLIEQLQAYSEYLGVTTTALTDGASTNPITINGESVTAKKGEIVNYGSKEFIFNGTVWQEFGDLSALGSLAYKNTASGTTTPTGTVSQPSFTGTQGNLSVSGTPSGSIGVGTGTANYTPGGTVSQPNFTGSEGNVSVKGTPSGTISTGTGAANYTPAGSVSAPSFTGTQGNVSVSGTPAGSIGVGDGTANYTPSGSVSTPEISVSLTKTNKYVASSATGGGQVTNGTAAACTLPTLTTTVTDGNLIFSWTAGSFTANTPTAVTLPTFAEQSIATDVSSATATQPTFSGTGVDLEFTGSSLTSTGTFTPQGSVGQPTFTGTGAELKFTGAETTSTGKFTPAGEVSQPTFSGTGVDLEFTGSSLTSTGTFTPEGTVSQPSFTGNEATVTVS